MSNLNVLISGCGIAGGVFANCLLRAYPNANITIVERDPAPRLTGASVDIRSSAVDIIKWMGVEQEIRNHTTNEEGMQLVEENGTPIATFRATGNSEMQSMTSEYEIFRGELAKIFLDPVIKQVKLIFDESVEKYEQRDKSVVVTFAKSKEVKTYDLLVAADGIGSKIRGIMLNNTKPLEQLHDEGVHVAYFTIKSDILDGSRLAKGYSTTGGRMVFVRPDPHPDGRTRGHFMVTTHSGDIEVKERLNKALRDGHESYMTLMEEVFHDVGWLTPKVLQGMRESDDFYCSIFGQIRSPKIQDGRVVLLGDAGYATPGIGTSLAIIGGYVLAGELLSHPGDIDTAVKRYEEIVLPFAKGSQEGGGTIANIMMQLLHPKTQWGISIRNAFLGFVTWIKLDRMVMTVAATLGFTEKKVSMPDYPWPAGSL